jgi:hypothetical protein
VIASSLHKLIHYPCPFSLCNIISIKNHMQWKDGTQLQNEGHDKRGVPASYCVHIQEPRFSFFGREMLAGVGVRASSDSDTRIGFLFGALEGDGSTCTLLFCSFISRNMISARSYERSDHVAVSVIPNSW